MSQPRKSTWTPTRIRALRESFGLTQADMASLVGVGYQSVWRWERHAHADAPLCIEPFQVDLLTACDAIADKSEFGARIVSALSLRGRLYAVHLLLSTIYAKGA